MIADDAGFIREMLGQMLRASGHHIVAEATTGTEAIIFALEAKPDLIFLDLVLPELNGIEAASEILQDNPLAKIIAMSAMEQDWIQEKAIQAGCLYFMKKPFTQQSVAQSIDAADRARQDVQHG